MRPELDLIVPDRMRLRPVDRRGYPIPYTAFIDGDGKPDFTLIDPVRVLECAEHRVCGLCGEKIGYRIAFVGGPLTVRNRVSNDPGMHVDCGHFATMACPHLALEGTRYARHTQGYRTVGQVLSKSPITAMAITRSFKYTEQKLFKFATPIEIRYYPFGCQGSFYHPDAMTQAAMCDESQRRAQEEIRSSFGSTMSRVVTSDLRKAFGGARG